MNKDRVGLRKKPDSQSGAKLVKLNDMEESRETTAETKEVTPQKDTPEPRTPSKNSSIRTSMPPLGINPLAGFDPSKVLLKPSGKSVEALTSNQVHDDKPVTITSTSAVSTPLEISETQIIEWINKVTGKQLKPNDSLSDQLKDGHILCTLMNSLEPSKQLKIKTGKAAFFHRVC